VRVRASDGRIVRLVHFSFREKHVSLLLTLQQEVPNIKVDVRDEITHAFRQLPVFQLNLEKSEITHLNPDAT
jgi:hypothetical protein